MFRILFEIFLIQKNVSRKSPLAFTIDKNIFESMNRMPVDNFEQGKMK